MQRVTPNIKYTFVSVEQALRELFILSLFHGLGEETPRSRVTHLPEKHTGLSLTDPTKTEPEN